MRLYDIAKYIDDKISSNDISLIEYVTTDSLLQNKEGRICAQNLPPIATSLTRFQIGDVLIANIRPYLKKIWLADICGGCSSDVIVIRPRDGYTPEFLYATICQDRFFDYVMKGKKGSKMPRGDKNQIMRFSINNVPNFQTHNIGDFVQFLLSQMELSKAINHNLEALAKQLYDYWFVQFDFPDENGRPYKSSGGKMVWNEKLKLEIPDGWTNGVLSDVANIMMGQSPDGNSYNDAGEGIIFYQGSTDFGIRFPKVRQYTTEPSRLASKGDILMSVRAPVGAINIANNDCCIGRGLSALNSKVCSTSHLYHILDGFRVAFERRNAIGTTFGSITKDDLYSLPIVIPRHSIVAAYELVCKPIFNKQMEIGKEIDSLTTLRDELLPMLMNGQVSVNYDLSR